MEDNSLFDLKTALEMVDNDKSLLQILISGFLNDAPFDKAHLLNLILKKDFSEAAHYVHRVKGAARQLAASELAKTGQSLEDILRGKTEGDPVSLAESFAGLYEKTWQILNSINLD